MAEPLLVKDVMSTRLVTLAENEAVSLAEQLMQAIDVRHLPVVAPGDRLVGVVSDRDLLAAAASSIAKLHEEDARAFKRMIPVEQIMTRDIRVASPNTRLREAAKLLVTFKIGCLPVVEDGILVGILTETDLVEVLIDILEDN